MYKYISAKYCQENKGRLRRKSCKRYQNLFKEGKKISDNMVMSILKTLRKWNTKASWV